MGSYAAGPTSATVTMLTDAGMSKVAAAGSGAGGASSTPAFAVKEYTVRGVLGPTSRQAEVYDATLAAIVPRLFEGHNACCALYGMTGSGAYARNCHVCLQPRGMWRCRAFLLAGKTHTFSGPVGASATDFGLMQRAFHDIFARCAVLAAGEADENSAGGGGGGQRATVKVDFIEVYNDNVYDLLAFADAVADAPTNHKGARDRFLCVAPIARPSPSRASRCHRHLRIVYAAALSQRGQVRRLPAQPAGLWQRRRHPRHQARHCDLRRRGHRDIAAGAGCPHLRLY